MADKVEEPEIPAPTVGKTRIRELDQKFRLGELPEQSRRPELKYCGLCKRKGFIIVKTMIGEAEFSKEETCGLCLGKGAVPNVD